MPLSPLPKKKEGEREVVWEGIKSMHMCISERKQR